MGMDSDKKQPVAWWADDVQPPTTITVVEREREPRPVLYRHDGTPLVRDKRVGFDVTKRGR